ncbi:MAG TPA: aldo/keto reductase, partial [Kofleriaceae bacterium]|nr:aldo/keto reductase [Kofleriaceae bacterium]
MQRRRLGSSDREVGVIGLGCKGLTGARLGVEPADVQRTVAAAIEAGCELLDLSAPGSAGDAERRVGVEVRALRARDRVVVATAAGGGGRRPPVAPQVQRTVEESLRALRLEAIPLVQLPGWDDAWLDDRTWPELRGTLGRLIDEGKVLAWGAVVPDGAAPSRVLGEP